MESWSETYNRIERLRSNMVNERSSFRSHWKAIGDFLLPRRHRFQVTDVNRGERRNLNIIDATASLALRTLRSGMMAGITSPSRPWFRLATQDVELSEDDEVKWWLHDVTKRMSDIFMKSNLYNTLPNVYGDLGGFGTSAMLIEEDIDDVVRFYSYPVGSYMLGNDDKLKARVWFREFQLTVRQVVDKFSPKDQEGKPTFENISEWVKTLYKNGQTEGWVNVNHVIEPNQDYNPNSSLSKNKRFSSIYYESGGDGTKSPKSRGALSIKGYDKFPVFGTRWEVAGEDVYGTNCPGMEALGDIKQLQLGEKRGMQAVEKMVNPPMVGSPRLRQTRVSILPGDITYNDETANGAFKPAHEVRFSISELEEKQAQLRQRLSRTFYEDLFLMLAQSDRKQITAREIDERHEEKLLILGPVLEQLNQDLLNPLIDNTFDIMFRNGLIPPPPEELEGRELKVEYVSIMAQAQKMAGISGLERGVRFVLDVAGATQNPAVLDKLDTDQAIDEYFDALGTPPRVIRGDEQVEEIRGQRAQAEQARAQQESLMGMAKGAKDLAGADMEGDNALKRLIGKA